MIDSEADLRLRSSESYKESWSMLRHMHPHYIYIYIYIFCITVFCKQKEFNFEIIFVPIVEHDFGYFVINGIKFHLWFNAYFFKGIALNL